MNKSITISGAARLGLAALGAAVLLATGPALATEPAPQAPRATLSAGEQAARSLDRAMQSTPPLLFRWATPNATVASTAQGGLEMTGKLLVGPALDGDVRAFSIAFDASGVGRAMVVGEPAPLVATFTRDERDGALVGRLVTMQSTFGRPIRFYAPA